MTHINAVLDPLLTQAQNLWMQAGAPNVECPANYQPVRRLVSVSVMRCYTPNVKSSNLNYKIIHSFGMFVKRRKWYKELGPYLKDFLLFKMSESCLWDKMLNGFVNLSIFGQIGSIFYSWAYVHSFWTLFTPVFVPDSFHELFKVY